MRKSCHTATRRGHTTSNSFLVPLCRRSSLLWMTNTTCEACSSQSAGHCSTHSCVCSSSTSFILFLWLLILMPGLEFLPKQTESHSGPVRDHSEAGPFKGGLQVCVIAAASLGYCCCSCQYFNTVDSNQSFFETPSVHWESTPLPSSPSRPWVVRIFLLDTWQGRSVCLTPQCSAGHQAAALS